VKRIHLILAAAALLLAPSSLRADPRISSWFTDYSGKYARIFQSTAAETAGNASVTWSRGQGTQSLPTYSGVHEVSYSANWVYIRTTGLAGHVMGPWYLDAAKTTNFPNFPSNTAAIYRIPRTPVVPGAKTLTGAGAIGFFVNGVAFFDNRDTFSYSNANGMDASPVAGIGMGDGIWIRNALVNEGNTFDAALAHQAGNQYHYHVQPVALRHQLGDHVDYNPATNRYTESIAPPTAHSPILAWAADGFPVYGPYGYATATDAGSGVRRMVSGFVLRNGANGTTNLAATGRQTLPAWAAATQNRSATLATNQYGPAVSTTYVLGHYLEDHDYLGDLGFTQGVVNAGGVFFDLDRYNGRTCVTPEFPGGTYAYFSTIAADGTPAFPYNIGRQYYGSPTGGTVTSITETVATSFSGGPNAEMKAVGIGRDTGTGAVTVTWSSVEGGTYKVEAVNDLAGTWGDLQTGVASGGIQTSVVESAASQAGATQRFYRMSRTALAAFDATGFNYTAAPGAPTVVTGAASNTSTSGATLNGTITANGYSTATSFEYGPTTAYGSTVAATPANVTGTTATSVSAAITGLTANATYHFRAKGVNSAGTVYGSNATFTASNAATSVAPGGSAARGTTVTVTITLPTAPPQPPANLVPTSVTLAGTITGTSISRPAQGTVIATFAIPAGAATGPQNIVVTFNPAPTYTMTGAFTIN
jgi:YHYH protein